MNKEKLLSMVDHTLLSCGATKKEIEQLCSDAVKYNTACVCVAPCYVSLAAHCTQKKVAVCTVVGFPNGYSTCEAKCFEASQAVKNGADEIDMVINIGLLKDKKYNEVLEEIKAVKNACMGKTLKVIIEACLLTEEEKIKMCHIVSQSGADYIKTSTGFSTGGATFEDVKLMAENVDGIKIKAAGGIKSFEDAKRFWDLGAQRLGTSQLVKLMKLDENKANKQ